MSVTPYTPGPSKIVHESRVDFRQRVIQSMIHIVQYDKSLPIIAVELYSNGQKWTLPSDANVKVRWGKRDHTYVYLDVLGCNADRTVVYFEIVEQMTVFYGEHNPVLEVIIGESIACSSYIPFYIDRNPIQRTDIESEVVPSVVDMLEAEIRSKQNILVSGTNIKTINGQSILGTGDLVISVDTSLYYTKTETDNLLLAKQPTLVSGTNIKTINSQSLLGPGDLTIQNGPTIVAASSDFTADRDAIIAAWPTVVYVVTDGNEKLFYYPIYRRTVYGTVLYFLSNLTGTRSRSLYFAADGTSPSTNVIDLIDSTTISRYYTKTETDNLLSAKQPTLVSGTNIKTINGQSLLGNGNLSIKEGMTIVHSSNDFTVDRDAIIAAWPNVIYQAGSAMYMPSAYVESSGKYSLQLIADTTIGTTITIKSFTASSTSAEDTVYFITNTWQSSGGASIRWIPTITAIEAYLQSNYQPKLENTSITAGTATTFIGFDSTGNLVKSDAHDSTKQDLLVSGTNIKTINGQTLLGSGDLVISTDLSGYYTKTETDNLLSAKADDSNVIHKSGGGTISPSSSSSTQNLRTDLNGSTIEMYDSSDPYRFITLSLSNSAVRLNNTSSYRVASVDYTGFISKFGRYTASGYRYAHDGIHKITNDTETDLYSFPNSAGTIALTSDLDSKQDTLVSGTNIKTVNGYSLVGSGNVDAVKKVVLYSGACGNSVLLNENYTLASDFDIVLVFLQYNGTDTQQSHCIIDASWMNNINNSYNYNIHENVVKLQYNPDTHYLWNANSNCQIYKVIGLKFNNA